VDEAIRDLTSAVNLEPELHGVHNNLGAAWHARKEYDRAIECYSREIELNPGRFTTYFNRAMALADSGAPEKALEDLDVVMNLSPDNYMALAYRGDLLERTGAARQAVAVFEKVLEMDPGNDYARSRIRELKQEQAVPAVSGTLTVQAGAFRSRDNAKIMADRLKKAGFHPVVKEMAGEGGPPWYLVRIGSFTTRKEAGALVETLKAGQGIAAVIRPGDSL
jgi:tetratricopeptide (TPR) repeat protein